jgi:hypothetical protein
VPVKTLNDYDWSKTHDKTGARTARSNGQHKALNIPTEAEYQTGFLARLDGRTEIARQLKVNYHEITEDLGGESALSHMQRALVERATFLEAVLADMEAGLASAKRPADEGERADALSDMIGKWVQALNCYVGLTAKLGLKRRKKVVDLREYKKRLKESNASEEPESAGAFACRASDADE